MKKTFIMSLAIVSISLLGISTLKAQSMGGGGHSGSGYSGGGMGGGGHSGYGDGMGGGNYSGYDGGMGGGGLHGYGAGMTEYDEGMVPYSPRDNHQDRSSYEQRLNPMGKREAREMLENYFRSKRNPNLKVGEIEDMGPDFKAEVVTKDGSLVDKVAVDKNNGSIRSLY